MGSPISSTIAQIVMEYLEESVLQKLNYNGIFFKRYVDDCLLAIPEDKLTHILITQYLEIRINGHKYTKNASTALHKHESKEKHELNFSNAKILDKDPNYNKLLFKEMIYIKKEKNIVNDKKDIQNLSQIYNNLINKK